MMHHTPLIATALFLILSSSPAYHITNHILPTQRFGAPTQLGLLVHAAVFFLLLSALSM